MNDREVQSSLLRECEPGCVSDNDCKGVLLCSKQHTGTLVDLRQDSVKAYCGPVGNANQYVCYNAKRTKSAACARPYPKPGKECTSRDAVSCVAPPVCCRTLKTVKENGDIVCNSRKCNFTYRCACNARNFSCTSRQFQCIPDKDCSNKQK